VRRIQEFVLEDLSNWYVRRARRRFWAEELTDDKRSVYATTYEILKGVAQLAAPFAPFLTDEIYTKLTGEESVHISRYPESDGRLIDENTETRMDLVRTFTAMGRGIRERERIKVRQPLMGIHVDGKYEPVIGDLAPLIMEELNVRRVVFERVLDSFIDYSVKPDYKTAGPALGAGIRELAEALEGADAGALIEELERSGEAKAGNVTVRREHVVVRIEAKEGFSAAMEDNVFAILDTQVTPELMLEGFAREVVSKVQQLRKQHAFAMMDNIRIFLGAGPEVREAVDKFREYIMKETLAVEIAEIAGKDGIEEYDINGHRTGIAVEKV